MLGFKLPPRGKEYYFIRNEGFERRIILSSQEDYDRFEAYLYLLNATESPRAANFFIDGRSPDVFNVARGERLVGIGAYSFLARDFYLLLTPLADNGIAKFMQKLQTAYTMYFNKKYHRSGRLFHSAYRAAKIAKEENLLFHFCDIHLQPAELFNDAWEEADAISLQALAQKAMQYRYSGAGEYASRKFAIIDPASLPEYFKRARKADFYVRNWLKTRGRPVS